MNPNAMLDQVIKVYGFITWVIVKDGGMNVILWERAE